MQWYKRRALILLVLACALSSCSSGSTGALPQLSVPNIAAISRLQLAVGTATVAEPGGAFEIGLNVVTTFRQPGGGNATLQNTPTLSGPMIFIANGSATTTPHVVAGLLPTQLAALAAGGIAGGFPDSTLEFGATVGVFGYGLAGDNTLSPTAYSKVYGEIGCTDLGGVVPMVGSGSTGSPGYNTPRSQELALPALTPRGCGFVGTFTGKPTTVAYYGGPPAWPSPAGYGELAFFRGFPLGFTDFASVPVPGTYSLTVKFATSADYSTFATVSASASLPSLASLPVFAQPVLHVQNDGSALVDVNVPAGVSEAIINVETRDCLFVANRPDNHYSLITRSVGAQTLFLSSNLGPPGPSGNPTHTFCTLSDVEAALALEPPGTVFPPGAGYTLTAVGFDYQAFEASYPQSTSLAPQITNSRGTADITTSDPLQGFYTWGTG